MEAYTMKTSRGAALFLEMGCGKSKVIIDTFEILYKLKLVKKGLVISPLSILNTWGGEEGELKTHAQASRWRTLIGSKPQRKKLLDAPISSFFLQWFLLNIDAVQILQDELSKHNFDFVVIDESTIIKNKSAIRTKAVIDLFSSVPYKVILSGNPVPKSPTEIFSQFKFIEQGVFGSNYTKFADYFFDQDFFKKCTGFKSGKEAEYNDKFHSISFRKTKAECLDLPPKIHMKEWVDLTGEQYRVYKEMHEDAVASLEDSTITAPVVITKILRLSQISGGIFPRSDGSIKYFNPNPKLSRLLELISELPNNEQFAVWARFQGEIELISIALSEAGISNAKYYGKTTVEQRNIVAVEFFHKRIRGFVGNPATGGKGINFLKNCTNVFYYSNDFSAENRQQSSDRHHRSGTTGDHVMYVDILAKDTIDPLILNVLQQNKDFSDQILNRNIKI